MALRPGPAYGGPPCRAFLFTAEKPWRGRVIASVCVAEHPEPISLVQAARGADVLSLVHEGHMYRVDGARSRVDDVLELAAPINQGALGPAVAGGWAAVESLLFNPDDPA